MHSPVVAQIAYKAAFSDPIWKLAEILNRKRPLLEGAHFFRPLFSRPEGAPGQSRVCYAKLSATHTNVGADPGLGSLGKAVAELRTKTRGIWQTFGQNLSPLRVPGRHRVCYAKLSGTPTNVGADPGVGSLDEAVTELRTETRGKWQTFRQNLSPLRVPG